MAYKKTKGNKFETKIANAIHEHLLMHSMKYASLWETVGHNEDLKPRRSRSSGAVIKEDGDVQLGIAKTFFPISIGF